MHRRHYAACLSMKSCLKEIAELTQALLEGSDREIEILLTDSRSLSDPAKSLFFAIRGERNDGHRYISELYAKGVRAFVVDHLPENMSEMPSASWIVVSDTLVALQIVGAMGRRNAASIVAITGSRGKTTLKEWMFQILSPSRNVSRSPRSFNSRIGVPLSLWGISPGSDVALIEAGISAMGEMKPLSMCIMPDIVVITNVGDAHAQGFPSLADKVREKVSLAAVSSVKKVIYCADDTAIDREVKLQCQGKQLIGWHKSDLPANPFGTEFCKTEVSAADIENAGNAMALASALGLDNEAVMEAIKSLHRIGTRLNVSEGVNNCLVIYDSYTSDQSSLVPALDFMKRRVVPGSSETLIVSDLLHEADSMHEACVALTEMMQYAGVKRLIAVGKGMRSDAEILQTVVDEALFFDSTEELLANLSTSDFCNETILIKGAHDFGFDRVAELLVARTHETVLEVNLDALVRNYNYFREKLPYGVGIVAMVKASGYGAGSYEIAKTIQDCGAAYLAVAVLDEGIELRRRGITMPIMVMNPQVVNYRQMFEYRLEPEVFSMSMLHDVMNAARKYGATQ